MAMSNFDACAWDKFGDPRKADLTFPGGIVVEIYKDWLLVRDPTSHHLHISISEGSTTVYSDKRKETIIHIDEGRVTYKNIDIRVERQGVNAAVPTFVHAMFDGDYDNEESSSFRECDPIVFCGIGKYAFKDDEWVGITLKDQELFGNWLKEIDSPVQSIKPARPYNQGDVIFCGVDHATNRYGSDVTVFGAMLGMKPKKKRKAK